MSLRTFSRVVAAALVVASACGGSEQALQRHQEKLDSAIATTFVVTDAWLAGRASGTYTRTALERAFVLVESERAALARTPASLAEPHAARMARDADNASRALALLTLDVRAGDGEALRQHLEKMPARSGGRP